MEIAWKKSEADAAKDASRKLNRYIFCALERISAFGIEERPHILQVEREGAGFLRKLQAAFGEAVL